MNERHVELGADVKSEREREGGKRQEREGSKRQRGMERERNTVLLYLTIEG